MQPTIKIDTTEFRSALRQMSGSMKRELSVELNTRMFYVMLRYFVLLEPRQIATAKAKAKAYLNAIIPVQKQGKASELLRRVHLIAQGRRKLAGKRPLLPMEIKKQAATAKSEYRRELGSIRRRAAAQGYFKSVAVRAMTALSKVNLGRSFSQFGRAAKVNKKTGAVSRPEQRPNAALLKVSAEYGIDVSIGQSNNVGVFKGSLANVVAATPGINPTVTVDMSSIVADKDTGKMNAKAVAALQRAINDETAQMKAKLAERAQAVANRFSA